MNESVITLLGVLTGALTSYFSTLLLENKKQKNENVRYLRQKKESAYQKIIKFILIETENIENKHLSNYNTISTKDLVEDIEILIQLYAPRQISKLFYNTYEAISSDLPDHLKQSRLDSLLLILRKDIGLAD
ncbi:MAG: hypothetical protein ACOX7K_05300 [Oscillospiraceae bacterium]|jgi:gas vesicle protein